MSTGLAWWPCIARWSRVNRGIRKNKQNLITSEQHNNHLSERVDPEKQTKPCHLGAEQQNSHLSERVNLEKNKTLTP